MSSEITIYDTTGNPQTLSGNKIKLIGGVGYNQEWVDETANRALDTEYTNDTGKPIMISVIHNGGSDGASDQNLYLHVYINGAAVCTENRYSIQYPVFSISAIIPPGDTYKVTGSIGAASTFTWLELKGDPITLVKDDPAPLARTWQDLTASRALETDYTNDTGSDIMIAVTINSDTINQSAVKIIIDGVNVIILTTKERNNSADTGVTLIVPAGAVYRVEASNGTPNLSRWTELRN